MSNVLQKLKKILLHPNFRNTVIVFFSIVTLSVLIHLFSYAFSNDQNQKSEDYNNSNYRVFGLNIPKNLNFAGERVPQNDFSIKESLDREFLTNTYWQSNAMLLFKRANRWFPIIEPILKKNNIPDDFKYVALIESHLTNAVSPRGATGFWQFVEETGTHYGLEINSEVDERYNVEKSTQAACKYFKDAHDKFGNWTLAAASYNLGMGGIETQLKKQKVTNYYDLMLNEETGRYVYRLLAFKTILQNPKQFGFEIRKKDLYHRIPTISIKVNESIPSLVDYSISKGYNYKILKLFNPWLTDTSLKNPEKKTYIIQFPTKEYLQRAFDEIVSDSLKNSLHLDSSAFANPGDTLKLK